MNTQHIAQTVLDLFEQHEASWDGNKYTLAPKVWDLVEPFLLKQKDSAFAITLVTFGWQYTNDVQNICNLVVKKGMS